MAIKVGVTIDEWLLKAIEADMEQKGKTNRSEHIAELCAKGLGFEIKKLG